MGLGTGTRIGLGVLGVLAAGLAMVVPLVVAGAAANPLVAPPLGEVLRETFSGPVWAAAGQTLAVALPSFLVAALLGLLIGVPVGGVPVLHALAYPALRTMLAVPVVALVPLPIIWFGLGAAPAVLAAVVGALWTMLTGVVRAMGEARDRLQRLGHPAPGIGATFGEATGEILWAVRWGWAMALIMTLTAEMLLGRRGIGGSVMESFALLAPSRAIAGGLVALFCAALIEAIIGGIGLAVRSQSRRPAPYPAVAPPMQLPQAGSPPQSWR